MKLRRGDGLNLIPFIDIMLVLLALVLSVSTFIAQGQIPVDVPKTNTSQNPKNEEKFTIIVNAQNDIFINNQKSNLALLKEKLRHFSPQTLVELKSDKESKFDVFVQILDLLQANDHENFVISVKKN